MNATNELRAALAEAEREVTFAIQRFEIATGMRVHSIKIHPGGHTKPAGAKTAYAEIAAQLK